MTNILNQVQEFIENTTGNPETQKELLNLKKELAKKVIEKFKSEKWNLLLSTKFGENAVEDYLVKEDIFDAATDHLWENSVLILLDGLPELKDIREKLNNAKTSEQLKDLETEIL